MLIKQNNSITIYLSASLRVKESVTKLAQNNYNTNYSKHTQI